MAKHHTLSVSVHRRAHGRPKSRTPPLRTLVRAIQLRTGIDEPAAKADARRLLTIFSGRTRIEDEPLDKETRAFLYRLHAAAVVRTLTEERRNARGRPWLYFHWLLEPEHIVRIADSAPTVQGPAAFRAMHHPAAPPPTVA